MRNPLIATLRITSFLYLVVSEFFSQFAMNLLNFILLIVVFQISGSNLAVAGVVLSFTLPSIIFGILAGVYVDKWNKKNVLIYTNLLRALAAFPLIFISHQLFLVYLLCFLISLITQFFIPAETPIIPHLVPRKLLLSANAIFSMGIYGSIILAYGLSGPLLLLIGKTNVFILITALFVVAAFFAYLIKFEMSRKHLNKQKINVMQEIRGAFVVMKSNKKIYHSLFLLTLLQTIVLVIAVIGPGYAEHVLNIQVEKFPILFVTPAVIGMSIGAILIGNFLHDVSKPGLAKLGLVIIGVTMILFPNLYKIINFDSVNVMVGLSIIIGFAFALVFVPSNTIIQEETNDEQRGKIYGSLNTMVGIVSLIPVLSVGLLADSLGVARVITMIGVGVVLIAAIRIFKFN